MSNIQTEINNAELAVRFLRLAVGLKRGIARLEKLKHKSPNEMAMIELGKRILKRTGGKLNA